MKIVCVDVRHLATHAKKHQVRQAFENLGWSAAVGMASHTSLTNEQSIDYYEFTWWDSWEPVYPDIPAGCVLTKIS